MIQPPQKLLTMLSSKLIITLLLLITAMFCKAQLQVPYVLGSIGMTDSTPTHLNYAFFNNGKCLQLESGIGVIGKKIKVTGKFTPVCPEIISQFSACPLVGYPNPTSNYTYIRTSGCFDTYNFLKGTLVVNNAGGKVILARDIVIADLRAGLRIDLSSHTAGFYYAKIQFQGQIQTIKIIKLYGK
jgi:hypothetical protein